MRHERGVGHGHEGLQTQAHAVLLDTQHDAGCVLYHRAAARHRGRRIVRVDAGHRARAKNVAPSQRLSAALDPGAAQGAGRVVQGDPARALCRRVFRTRRAACVEPRTRQRQRRGLEGATPAPTRYITKNKTVLLLMIDVSCLATLVI